MPFSLSQRGLLSLRGSLLTCLACLLLCGVAIAEDPKSDDKKKPEFPTLDKVTKDFTKVESSEEKPYYDLWVNKKTGQVLGKLPKDYEKARQYIAPTVAGGEVFAGLQSRAKYVYWRKFGKRLAMMQENLSVKGSDAESKSSVNRLFTDRVLLSVPILTIDGGRPVINLNQAFLSNSSDFFDSYVSPNTSLVSICKAKTFPENVELCYEVPMYNGALKKLHFSVSKIRGSKNYKPRKADQRVGYFLTQYSDFGKYNEDETDVRYINRWHLEKRSSKLRLSPPKQPIIFYIEHTTPVRYRRFVREGILYWNKAFEKVGIVDAIEVRQQDKESGEHMEKDPEDVRFNFVRWLNNNVSTAIGPSRVNPKTGEILDADIILTDGWIRTFRYQFSNIMPKLLLDGASPEELAWYVQHPNWDPRVRMAEPSRREFVMQQIRHEAEQKFAKRAKQMHRAEMMGEDPMSVVNQNPAASINSGCFAADGRSMDVAFMRMAMEMRMLQDDDDDDDEEDLEPEEIESLITIMQKKLKEAEAKLGVDQDEDEEEDSEDEDKKDEDEDEEDKDEDEDSDDEDDEDSDDDDVQLLDGMPETFIGSLLSDLVAHEVGHTLGLRHNFKASSIYDIAEMNSELLKGVKPFTGSVMDYNPTNFFVEEGDLQGDWAMIGVGPYDMWAIEYGYSMSEKKLPKILAKVSEPQLAFATDEDTAGPDPLARRYDFGKNPLDFAHEQVALAKLHRGKIIDKFVKKGEPWSKARKGYLMTLTMQTRSSSMMANWVGGTFVNRDKKGDPEERAPLDPVSAEDQREALEFVLESMFQDESFGLNPKLLKYMAKDHFSYDDPTWPIHDRVMSLQAGTLSQLMSPSKLRNVYDNEYRIPEDEDAFTLNELMTTISDAIWSELEELPEGEFTERKPAISSMRRNLQTEFIERLFDLAKEEKGSTAALKPIANLAAMKLQELHDKLGESVEAAGLDAYSKAHLADAQNRVKRFLDGTYVVNQKKSGGGGFPLFLFGKEPQVQPQN